MATIIIHRKVNIVILGVNENLAGHCHPGDIAIAIDNEGWWVKFIDANGDVTGYEAPYASSNEALWAAKAAAEFGIDN